MGGDYKRLFSHHTLKEPMMAKPEIIAKNASGLSRGVRRRHARHRAGNVSAGRGRLGQPGHIRLMVAMESAFGVRIKASEVAKLNNVGELAELIERKLG